jgi:hypothetical protein
MRAARTESSLLIVQVRGLAIVLELHPFRPVTPEVAGSSPVAPARKPAGDGGFPRSQGLEVESNTPALERCRNRAGLTLEDTATAHAATTGDDETRSGTC